MNRTDLQMLYEQYTAELKEQILPFWMARCEDKVYGGFVNCFDNLGQKLISYDKYTWSQGRFAWMFAKLAGTGAPLFTGEERQKFLRLSDAGCNFLEQHCLMGRGDWRCVFLMERDGSPKYAAGCNMLDASIYADCFAVIGFARNAAVSGNPQRYAFAKALYDSCLERLEARSFHTLPYPLSKRFLAHGIPMIFSNVTAELYHAAQALFPEDCPALRERLRAFASDILLHFTGEDHLIREVITADHTFFPQVLGRHINPGHSLEDVWFELDAAAICGEDWEEQLLAIARATLEAGWDKPYGGLLHFAGLSGGRPAGDLTGVEEEPMAIQLDGWSDKLWWVHSEALYCTLRCYLAGGGEDFLDWHKRIAAYTFPHFRNPDQSVREWIQILTRDGTPQEKVVALPVKDPFHITRNLILMVELLHERLGR